MNFSISLTNRQKLLNELSSVLNWNYLPDPVSSYGDLEHFIYFRRKLINYSYNSLVSENKNSLLFDLSYSEGAFIAKEDLKSTFLQIKAPYKMPIYSR